MNISSVFSQLGTFDFIGVNHYTSALWSMYPPHADEVANFNNDKNTKEMPAPEEWVG